MTPPTQSPVTDGQPNIDFDWLSGSGLSTLDWDFQYFVDADLSNFSTLDRSPGPELSFEDQSLEVQYAGGTQEPLLVGSSSLAGDGVVSTTTLGSIAPPITKAQSKSTLPHTVIDLTGADRDHGYTTPPDTPESGLSSSSSISSNSSTAPTKCRRTLRATTVKDCLANEIDHSSRWLARVKKSIDDCKADLDAMEKEKERLLTEIERKRKVVTRRKNEFIELKNSMVAWGALNEEVSEEWKAR
ncbi:hypothetical protein HYALB_00005102 [Hymenoscyphus albidus]|uniref:Uncharacterized protein n=1 Tax=Hymenoscyphus albidus TaxID=595503 RepID=A0A9N9QBA8_9HELO|nr:hypothetical protein HYALB_00005102 [Hymenoscyphus albidus]